MLAESLGGRLSKRCLVLDEQQMCLFFRHLVGRRHFDTRAREGQDDACEEPVVRVRVALRFRWVRSAPSQCKVRRGIIFQICESLTPGQAPPHRGMHRRQNAAALSNTGSYSSGPAMPISSFGARPRTRVPAPSLAVFIFPVVRMASEAMIVDRKPISIMKACELVGVSRRTIYNWIASGKVEYVRTAGGSVRIFVETLWREPETGSSHFRLGAD